MEKSKLKKLQQNGWVVGSVHEFLMLSREETLSIDERLQKAKKQRLSRQNNAST